MALYMDEAEIWKCPTHPSKRRRTGICPTCLRERLSTLCPNCAAVRPCSCCPATTSSSSSSASSSFSLFSTSSAAAGKTTNLLDGEPSFIRSRSLAIPFLRSRSRYTGGNVYLSDKKPPTAPSNNNHVKTSSFLSLFKTNRNKKSGGGELEDKQNEEAAKRDNDFASMLNRSRSVTVTVAPPSSSGPSELTRSSTKRRGWHFPSPMKAFRQSKTNNRFVEDIRSSPMCRV